MKSEDCHYIKDITTYLEFANISQYQKHQSFHVIKFEDHINEMPRKIPPQKYGFFILAVSKNQNVDIGIGDRKFKTLKENVSFIAPEQSLSVDVQQTDGGGVGYMLLFTPDFLHFTSSSFGIVQQFPFFNIYYSPVYFIEEEQKDFFINLIEKIYQYFKNFNNDNKEIIIAYVTIILFEAKKKFMDGKVERVKSSRAEEITFLFENLIKRTTHKRVNLSQYAKGLNISPIYLSECVKKATGKTAKQVITEYLIWEAKSLLLQTTLTIDDIALNLGYNDTSNFISFFKKNNSNTPNQYRKNQMINM